MAKVSENVSYVFSYTDFNGIKSAVEVARNADDISCTFEGSGDLLFENED